jgi:membrane protein
MLSAAAKWMTPQALPGGTYLWEGINGLFSLAFITVLFALIYKILPDVHVAWRDVWIGALVASALFAIGKFLIGLYLGRSSATSTFGAAASLAIVLIWVYYSAQILLFGAEFTRVYATRRRPRLQPASDAVRNPSDARTHQARVGR